MNRHTITRALTGALLSAAATAAFAQAYPNKPITFLYHYAPSATEQTFRAMFQEAQKLLGQNIVIEMKPGAGGKIGFDQMMKAPKDGYTLGFVNTPLAVNIALMDPTFRIEPVRDYTPVVHAWDVPLLLVVNPSLPFRDLKGMVSYGKSNPGKLNFGLAGGRGTTGHLLVELFNVTAGLQGTPVPYKGEGPAMTDLLGGQVQGLFGSVLAAQPHIEAGKLLAIAVTSSQRVRVMPNVPTMRESGVTDVAQSTTVGVAGPAGLPADMVRTLNKAFVTALQSADVRKKIEDGGMIVRATTPEELTETIRGDLKRWEDIVRRAKITLD